MKVYIVIQQWIHEDPQILQVFSSRQRATDFVKAEYNKYKDKKSPNLDIEEYKVNGGPQE